MKTPIRILGIAGSLRRGSYNRAALRAATYLRTTGDNLVPQHPVIPVNQLRRTNQHLFRVAAPQGARAAGRPRIDDSDLPARGLTIKGDR